jgi:WhiB family transcriptional regulator, redox-sensing transcriptional regulator
MWIARCPLAAILASVIWATLTGSLLALAMALAMAPRPEDWRSSALCAEVDPDAFFPEKGGSTRLAKGICRKCLVKAECLRSALTNDERFGIWGGLSERERRRLRLL